MNSCNHVNCVHSVPIFRGLDDTELSAIYDIAYTRSYAKGEVIYQQGDLSDSLRVVYQGSVKISRLNINGKQQVIRIVESGDFLGELSLFSQLQFSESATALDTCVICTISGNDFRNLIQHHPSISLKILDVMSRRLDQAEHTIESINHNSVTQRLALKLLELSDSNETIELGITKGDLASQLGMTQESLSRSLAHLEAHGMIQMIPSRSIKITNRERLKAHILE